MAISRRFIRNLLKLLLPIVILIILFVVGLSTWLMYVASDAPKAAYLITPAKYGQLSARGARITDETWTNKDGTQARGWLLRGGKGKPAIILLHQYGADRSHVLDRGVKLNELTDFTVLMPDLRGHGQNPPVPYTTFGGEETEDVLAAINFLKNLKDESNKESLISNEIAIYGVELGALAGFRAAVKENSIRALVLDSVPLRSDEILYLAIRRRFPFASEYTSSLASMGAYIYFFNKTYARDSLCDLAPSLKDRKIMLLAGADEPLLQDSTQKLVGCFGPGADIQSYTGLSPSGYNLSAASLEQVRAYDQRVMDFFKKTFSSQITPMITNQTSQITNQMNINLSSTKTSSTK